MRKIGDHLGGYFLRKRIYPLCAYPMIAGKYKCLSPVD